METKSELSILQKNLELIEKYNKGLVKNLINITELTNSFQFVEAKSGDTVLSFNDNILDDEIDPIDMAEKAFYRLGENDPDNFYIVFGIGLGYLLKKFASECKGKVIIFEPNLEILRIALEVVDFTPEFKKPNIFIVNNTNDLSAVISSFFTYGIKINLSALDSYISLYPVQYKDLHEMCKQVNPGEKLTGSIKLNIGAGQWKLDSWKTLDCYINADIKADLRKCRPLYVDDNQLEKVFSSHCIEHIETHHLQYLLKELYRCMKPGALLRLSCPDADQAFEAYRNNDIKWFSGISTRGEIGAKLVNTFVSYEAGSGGPPVTEEEVKEKFDSLSKDEFIEWCIGLCDRSRPYIAHINGIYYEKLEKFLREAGFVNIERSSFRKSKDPELRGPAFDLHASVSLFVECNKPS